MSVAKMAAMTVFRHWRYWSAGNLAKKSSSGRRNNFMYVKAAWWFSNTDASL